MLDINCKTEAEAKAIMGYRWTCQLVDVVTKGKLEAAGIGTLPSVKTYEVSVADEENPLLVMGDHAEFAERLRQQGHRVELMDWDEERKLWVDKISGKTMATP